MASLTKSAKVVLLLLTRLEWVRIPAQRLPSLPGEMATRKADCSACGGRGSVRRGRFERRCEACAGSGSVRVDPHIDDRRSEPVREAGQRSAARRRMEAELARLADQELHRRGQVGRRELEAWEAAKLALYRSGSYAELDNALARLELRDRRARAVIEVVFGADSSLRVVQNGLREQARNAIGRLCELMPDELLVPVWLDPEQCARAQKEAIWHGKQAAHQILRMEREKMIRDLRAEGKSVEVIAERVGLSRQWVSRILSGKETMG